MSAAVDLDILRINIHALADKYAREYGHLHPIVAELRELGGESS